MMKKVELELPFGQGPLEIHCPACGTLVSGSEGEAKPCHHVLFVFVDQVGEFEYVSPDLRRKATAARDSGNPVESIAKSVNSKAAFSLTVTEGGMACGPVWTTFTIAFDLGREEAAAPAVQKPQGRKSLARKPIVEQQE